MSSQMNYKVQSSFRKHVYRPLNMGCFWQLSYFRNCMYINLQLFTNLAKSWPQNLPYPSNFAMYYTTKYHCQDITEQILGSWRYFILFGQLPTVVACMHISYGHQWCIDCIHIYIHMNKYLKLNSSHLNIITELTSNGNSLNMQLHSIPHSSNMLLLPCKSATQFEHAVISMQTIAHSIRTDKSS